MLKVWFWNVLCSDGVTWEDPWARVQPASICGREIDATAAHGTYFVPRLQRCVDRRQLTRRQPTAGHIGRPNVGRTITSNHHPTSWAWLTEAAWRRIPMRSVCLRPQVQQHYLSGGRLPRAFNNSPANRMRSYRHAAYAHELGITFGYRTTRRVGIISFTHLVL